MVTSVNTSDDLPGVTKGGVASGPPMQAYNAPNAGTDGTSQAANLTHPNLQIDGAFAVGDVAPS